MTRPHIEGSGIGSLKGGGRGHRFDMSGECLSRLATRTSGLCQLAAIITAREVVPACCDDESHALLEPNVSSDRLTEALTGVGAT